jgi:hypothetical protein
MENNSDQNYDLLKDLSIFIHEPDVPKLFLGLFETRPGVQSSCLRSILKFHLEKQKQD